MSLPSIVAAVQQLLAVSPKPALTAQDIARPSSTVPNGNALAYIYQLLTLQGRFGVTVEAALTALADAMVWRGAIATSGGFPVLAIRLVGWTYFVTADGVTDAATGQTFSAGTLIVWNGVDWSAVGGTPSVFVFKGAISLNTDFPDAAAVQTGWLYRACYSSTRVWWPMRSP